MSRTTLRLAGVCLFAVAAVGLAVASGATPTPAGTPGNATPAADATATPTHANGTGNASCVCPGPPPWGPNDTQANDTDADGIYEDLNGNGRFDSDDVVTYFMHISEPWLTENADFYDVNRNGHVDFDDIVQLFQRL